MDVVITKFSFSLPSYSDCQQTPVPSSIKISQVLLKLPLARTDGQADRQKSVSLFLLITLIYIGTRRNSHSACGPGFKSAWFQNSFL